MDASPRKKSPRPPAKINSIRERWYSERTIAFWLGLALFSFYLLTTSAHQPTGDEEDYVAIATNIIADGTPAVLRLQSSSRGERTYLKYPIGHSLLLLPIVALQMAANKIVPVEFGFIPHLILNAFPAFLSAAMCALVFMLISLIGKAHSELRLSSFAAAIVTLITGIATQLWPASRTLFADNSVAFLLTLAVYGVVKFRHEDTGIGWLVTSACAASMMVLCKTLLILACPALVMYGAWIFAEHRKKGTSSKHGLTRIVVLTMLPFFAAAAIQFWYNDLRYGSIWISGYHQDRDGSFGFATPIWVGLYGIFFSSGRSFFLYSPLCILGLFGIRKFYEHARAELMLVLGICVPVVSTYAMWWSWHGGWEWGTRFYIFLIPLLMWISAPAWRWIDTSELSARSRKLRYSLLASLVGISVFVQVLGVLVHPIAYWKMTGSDLKVFEYRMYEKGAWEIRDDMPLAHFVPEFSPIAAHLWLVWATWNRHNFNEEDLAKRAPWTSLNPKWAPTNVRDYLGYDVWFVGGWIEGWLRRGGSLEAMFLTALFIAGMIFFALYKFWACVQRPAASSPNPGARSTLRTH